MSIVLSPEAAAKAEVIPDFNERLNRFIDHQYRLEEWRARHTTAGVRSIVAEGLAQGSALKNHGAGKDEVFQRLMTLLEEIPEPGVSHE